MLAVLCGVDTILLVMLGVRVWRERQPTRPPDRLRRGRRQHRTVRASISVAEIQQRLLREELTKPPAPRGVRPRRIEVVSRVAAAPQTEPFDLLDDADDDTRP